ncbi:WLM-domain-containing protein [Westerdykella ornata]|uniref:WLM-domain-containing protein n=1 Tax=Westerdykella ornata TaxID=318751 RepID=A0A6A6JPU5_WESOR|nr:WLM-domain-containing protein [Westerdykella ornata]KAF2278284.1 WLM-domain-containing protein [Westerdykella ornata]
MPLGFERINERTQRPNALINFIKPLPGATSETAEEILNRVAAICYPFMKKHMILVQALEEFPYNTEFVGRNFNAGEVIQLVLKNRHGQWLPEKWVMMVMVHELAHCKQMNHSKAFWKVRDAYAADLRELWSKGYTGEGLWGRGRSLSTGHVHVGSVAAGDVPQHLCGGTYGRRSKRRRAGKVREELTYAEKKQRRILKKFGAGGQTLGADDDTKVKLEGGVVKKGKPRVAGSARGRELRAAAALARFESVKEEASTIKREVESESETDDDFEETASDAAAIDVDGKKMVDDRGRALIKVCDHEDEENEDSRREMEEFRDLGTSSQNRTTATTSTPPQPAAPSVTARQPVPKREASKASQSNHIIRLDEIYKRRPEPPVPCSSSMTSQQPAKPDITCTICSLINEPGSLTCAACSHVLNLELVRDKWTCRSMACTESQLFGFLLGATTAAGAMYYYVIDEYRVSNELLTEDIYALQAAVQRIEKYVKEMEETIDKKKR